jgi:N-methylhydantoinase A
VLIMTDPKDAGAVWRIAADIGGTFTDLACQAPDGTLTTRKVPSTPDDYARAIAEGIHAMLDGLPVDGSAIEEVLHASTVATNAILEAKGAETALVTTAGFRDVLELRRIRVPRLYEPLYVKPQPLVPRRRRFEVAERIGARGEILTPLDLDAMRALAAELAASSVEAVAVCFLNSYANPAHERAAAAILREALPSRFISVSCEVLPEIREYERTSTTVANAYIGPVVARYLRSLQVRLKDGGIGGRLLMMQSSGGTLDVERVIQKPAQVVESGPAAGVIGAARLGALAGFRDMITFDMGGTTAKASLIEDGQVTGTDEYEVGGGISLSSRLMKGGGYALKLPVIDVSEVGAGGGSIVRVDVAGALKVGPTSAGASPGPACYGAGGQEPTVTDANVVLGYLNPEALAGGTVPIDAGLAHAALDRRVAQPLGCSILDAAFGVHRLANSNMMRAVKAVSTYRGRDPRDFTLFAFGGNGGIHAAALARELRMRQVVIPRGAGVFSAIGLLFADFEVARSSTFLAPLDVSGGAALTERFRQIEAEVVAEIDDDRAVLRWRAELRYEGQGFELPVDVPCGPLGAAELAAVRDGFEREHSRTYGHTLPGRRIDLVTLRAIGTIAPAGALPRAGAARPSSSEPRLRQVYFGPDQGLHQTPVIDRAALGKLSRQGPLVIEEYEGTTIVPPDGSATLDDHENIVITLAADPAP